MRAILLFAAGVVVLAQNPARDSNICLSNAAAAADQSLRAFETSLHGLLNLMSPPSAAEFSHVEELWHTYLDAASTAAFNRFDGTIRTSLQLEAHIRLVPSHLRELDAIYYSALDM